MPGAGLKKALNTMEGPIQPDIRQAPPRFVNAGKHWTVDTGQTILDLHDHAQTWDSAVLVESRAHNMQQYGISTHRDYVNNAFRPPLLRQEDVYFALSRQPRDPTTPHMNPGTDGVNTGFLAQTSTPNNIEKHIQSKVAHGYLRPTYDCPEMSTPITDSSAPERRLNRPTTSATTNKGSPYENMVPVQNTTPIADLYRKTPAVSGNTFGAPPVWVNGPNSAERMMLDEKLAPSLFVNPSCENGGKTNYNMQQNKANMISRPKIQTNVTPISGYEERNNIPRNINMRKKVNAGDANCTMIMAGPNGFSKR